MSSVRSVRMVAAMAVVLIASHANAQRTIPIRKLGPIEASSRDTVGFVRGVRELSDGRVMVNDPDNRRLLLFDASFAAFKVVADTTSGTGKPYGARPTSIIPFRNDSTLLVDVFSRSLVVIDQNGSMLHAIAAPRAEDVVWLANAYGQPVIDPKGRLVYRAYQAFRERPESLSLAVVTDSAPIIRADFETRMPDTVGVVAVPARRMGVTKLPDGRSLGQLMVNPLTFVDDWTALPDGSIAILRGQDYHIDWINADGTRTKSPKMPFDWRRLTDIEKQAILDSTKKAVAQQFAVQNAPGARGAAPTASAGAGSVGSLRSGGGDGTPISAPPPIPRVPAAVVPMSDLPDFIPPVYKTGTMTTDPDGNIWILPSTSSQAAGGLLYDVINRKGEIFERVQMPVGRALAGFGARGAVYLTAHDTTGTRLERARIVR